MFKPGGLEHGGRLRAASLRYGIALADWLDLSTGIAPYGWPLPAIPASAWARLPEQDDGLEVAARDPKRPEFGTLSLRFVRAPGAPGGLALAGRRIAQRNPHELDLTARARNLGCARIRLTRLIDEIKHALRSGKPALDAIEHYCEQ